MKIIECLIEGTAPLIQNRFGERAEVEGNRATRNATLKARTPRDQAADCEYRASDGTIWHPGAGIARLLREAGSSHKQRSTRKSVKFLVPAACIVLDDAIAVLDKNNKKVKTYEIDSRGVVIPATKGRVMRHRPRHDVWRMVFRLRVNENVLGEEMIHELLQQGGEQIGLGDFRPEKGGPFGTFRVLKWEVKK